jgi:hypothetical protein
MARDVAQSDPEHQAPDTNAHENSGVPAYGESSSHLCGGFIAILTTKGHAGGMRWQHKRPGSRARACLILALAGATAPTSIAVAAPIEASAEAPAEAGAADRARDQAIASARKAALEQAIAGLDGVTRDEAAVKDVLARPEAWTAAYRVLEVIPLDGRIEVRIEVEIDVPRLRKRVAASGPSRGPHGFRFGQLAASGCPAIDEAALREPLRAYGIISDGGDATLSLAITCSDRGAVTHTHMRAAAVEIVASSKGAVDLEVRFATQGFAEEIGAATQIALDRGVAELADELAVAARGDLELRVEKPWPAARVGVLERALRESVIGVDSVELAGIAADGSVLLRVGGRLDAKQLGAALGGLTFSGFALVGLRVDGAHALAVRMQ